MGKVNISTQVNMQPKQANHQLKLNLQTIMQVKANHKQMKPKQANHQLKAKTTPDMRKVKEHQPNMHMQVNMQHGP